VTETKQFFSLMIERLPDGGYVVTDGSFRRDQHVFAAQLFASSTIDEALRFIRDKLEPRTGEIKGGAIGKPSPVGIAFTGV
jgi:hypothetical protein